MATAQDTPQTHSYSRGWAVTLAALGINLASGTLYAWSVMGKALVTRKEDPWTKTQAAIPFAVATASFAIMMIFAGRMQDKLGPRRIALLGGVVLGLGFITASFAPTPPLMGLSFALVGMGIGLAYSATTPAAIKWFPPAKKGLITGLVVSGVGLAAVYASPLANYMLSPTGFHLTIAQTLRILGVGTIVSISVLALFVTNPPAGYVLPAPAGDGSDASKAKAAAARRNVDWSQMLQTPQFVLLWIMFVLAATPGLMIISNVATIAKFQVKWTDGFWPVMILAIFNACGRVVGGFVSDLIGRPQTMVLFFLLQAANMFAFSHYTTPALLLFGAGFTGLCYGTIFTLMPAATADFYGLRNMGVNYGLVFTAFGVAGSTGSLLGGKVADITKGSYFWAYMIVGVMLLIAAGLAAMIRAPKLVAEPAPVPA